MKKIITVLSIQHVPVPYYMSISDDGCLFRFEPTFSHKGYPEFELSVTNNNAALAAGNVDQEIFDQACEEINEILDAKLPQRIHWLIQDMFDY